MGGQIDLGAAFRRVLGDFRATYVLYYMPRGVETGGHHTLEVKTAREGTQVQARLLRVLRPGDRVSIRIQRSAGLL